MMLSNLPNYLESDILSRIPALANLKTTCKRWYALLRRPKFIEKNKIWVMRIWVCHPRQSYCSPISLHG
ncbi:hypothetical protein Bca4012_063739 [Brassica carinata]|uniref:F-box domain-containing protein n=1 Tax=Brassica carinata TaxID=52824 RepID=A0A8X7SIL1_BRACI|nr:hypothetical protein Bca52824_033340 [Brassica carinata]